MQILWITPRYLTPIFVGCDVIAFLVQVGGSSQISSENRATVELAFTIMKAGLAVQLACFGLFLVVAIRFHFKVRTFRQYWPDENWTTFLWVVNVAAVLIFVSRSMEWFRGRI